MTLVRDSPNSDPHWLQVVCMFYSANIILLKTILIACLSWKSERILYNQANFWFLWKGNMWPTSQHRSWAVVPLEVGIHPTPACLDCHGTSASCHAMILWAHSLLWYKIFLLNFLWHHKDLTVLSWCGDEARQGWLVNPNEDVYLSVCQWRTQITTLPSWVMPLFCAAIFHPCVHKFHPEVKIMGFLWRSLKVQTYRRWNMFYLWASFTFLNSFSCFNISFCFT